MTEKEQNITPNDMYLFDVYRYLSFEEFKKIDEILKEVERFFYPKDTNRQDT